MNGFAMLRFEFIIHNKLHTLAFYSRVALETTALQLALQKLLTGLVVGLAWNFHPKGQI